MSGWREYLRHLDYVLIAATAALIVYGVTMVYYATRQDVEDAPWIYVRQQLTAVAIGVVAAVVLSLLDYEVFRRFQWPMWALSVFSLLLLFPFGDVVNGARRWVDLGFTRFQPSALAYFLIALSIGAFLADRMDLLGAKRVTVTALALVSVPAALIYVEPDFGSAIVLVMLVLAMLFFYGTPWTHFAALVAIAAVAVVTALKVLPLAGVEVIKSYQIDRLLVFVNPGADPSASGYNVLQSMIAVGSGAFSGRGDMATQTAFDFLPEHHTDFIFAVISERNGFVGAAVLLLLYAVFLWRVLRIATLARDMYGSILAGGIAVMTLFQVFVNTGMTIGIMPVTGIPLPFVSYGGTAMIAFLMFVGLLQSIHLRAAMSPGTGGRLGQ